MSLPFSAEDTIRLHDAAFFTWLEGFKVDYNNIAGTSHTQVPMITVMASPHRAFATVVDTLVARNWVAQSNPVIAQAMVDQEWPVLPLPVATIERDDPILSGQLAMVPGRYRTNAFNAFTGQWDTYQHPSHYLTQYRLTFWCEKKYTHAYFIEWILSQLGQLGAGYSEVYIPVNHQPPFGTQLHALRYLGSANLDDLEGSHPRHIRKQLSFTLRSWFMRQPPVSGAGASPVFNVMEDMNVTAQDGVTVNNNESAPGRLSWGTFNLYNSLSTNNAGQVAAFWPTRGAAVVSQATSNAPGATQDLTVGVTAATDIVPLLDRNVALNAYGYNIVRIATNYKATADAAVTLSTDGLKVDTFAPTGLAGYTATTTLSVSPTTLTVAVNGTPWVQAATLQNAATNARIYTATTDTNGFVTVTFGDGISGIKPSGTLTLTYQSQSSLTVFSAPLSASSAWASFQTFAVTTSPRFQVNVAGVGSAAQVTTSGTDIRVIKVPSRVSPTSWNSSGVSTTYTFTGLAYQPYVAVVVYEPTNYTFLISVGNDTPAPAITTVLTATIGSIGVGAVFQPVSTSGSIVVTSAVIVRDVYLVPYTGIVTPVSLSDFYTNDAQSVSAFHTLVQQTIPQDLQP